MIENGMEEQYVCFSSHSVLIFPINGSCSQAFVSDHGSNLYALDLRNGKISFGYKGKVSKLI